MPSCFKCLTNELLSGVNLSNNDRPLTETELRRLQSKHNVLLKEMTLEGLLLDCLYAVHCINDKHKAAIENQSLDVTGKIREFLKILRRRSFAQFQLFLDCLLATHQQHVKDLLESSGGN